MVGRRMQKVHQEGNSLMGNPSIKGRLSLSLWQGSCLCLPFHASAFPCVRFVSELLFASGRVKGDAGTKERVKEKRWRSEIDLREKKMIARFLILPPSSCTMRLESRASARYFRSSNVMCSCEVLRMKSGQPPRFFRYELKKEPSLFLRVTQGMSNCCPFLTLEKKRWKIFAGHVVKRKEMQHQEVRWPCLFHPQQHHHLVRSRETCSVNVLPCCPRVFQQQQR